MGRYLQIQKRYDQIPLEPSPPGLFERAVDKIPINPDNINTRIQQIQDTTDQFNQKGEPLGQSIDKGFVAEKGWDKMSTVEKVTAMAQEVPKTTLALPKLATDAFNTYAIDKPADLLSRTKYIKETSAALDQLKGSDATANFGEEFLKRLSWGTKTIEGVTAGIIKPKNVGDDPATFMDKVIASSFQGIGVATGIGLVGGLTEGTLGATGNFGKMLKDYPRLAKYALPFVKNAVDFDIFGQLNPELGGDISKRLKQVGLDTIFSVPYSVLGQINNPFASVPASAITGWGIVRLEGGSNEDAMVAGATLAFLDAGMKLSASNKGNKVAEFRSDDQLTAIKDIKQRAIDNLNKYTDIKLSDNPTPEELAKLRKDLGRKYSIDLNPELNPKIHSDINGALDILEGKGSNPYSSVVNQSDQSSKPDTITELVKKLPEKNISIIHEALSKPIKLDTLKEELTLEEKQVMIDVLTAARKMPGTDNVMIDKNIDTLQKPVAEKTPVEKSVIDQNEKKVYNGVVADANGKVPDLSKIANYARENHGITVDFKGNIVKEGYASSMLDKNDENVIPLDNNFEQTFIDHFNALKKKYESNPLVHVGGWERDGQFIADASHVTNNLKESIYDGIIKRQDAIGNLGKYAKGEDGTIFITKKDIASLEPLSGGSLGSGKEAFKSWEEVVNYYTEKDFKNSPEVESFLNTSLKESGKIEKPAPKQSDVIKKATEVRAKRLEKEGYKKVETTDVTVKPIPREMTDSQAGSEVYQQLQTSEAGARIPIKNDGEVSGVLGQKSSFPKWVAKEYRSRKLFDIIQKSLINGMVPKGTKAREFYEIVREQIKRTQTESQNGPLNLSNKKIKGLLSEKEAVLMIREIENETNPNIRGVLQFKLFEKILSRAGADYQTLGQFVKDDMAVKMARNMSPQNFKMTLRHEIRHVAFELMSPKEQQSIITWYKGLSRQDLIKIYGDEKTLSDYEKMYEGNERTMADETANQSFNKSEKIRSLYRRILDFIKKIFHSIFGKKSTGQVRGLYKDVFNKVDGETFKRSPGYLKELKGRGVNPGLIKIFRGGETRTGGMASIKLGKSLVTDKGTIKVNEVFKSAWRKLYGEEAPGKLEDLLQRPVDKEVIHKEVQVAFSEGKKVAKTQSVEARAKLRLELAQKAKESRVKLRQMFKEKTASSQDIKKQVIEYVKVSLPIKLQGKFLNAVRISKTAKNLEKVQERVDFRRNIYERSLLATSITDIANNIDKLPVDIQRTVIGITSEIELKKHTRKLLDRLHKTQEYLDKSGTDMEMPRRVLNELGILERTPFEELSTDQLIAINNQMQQYNTVGRNIMKNKFILEKRSRELTLSEIEKNSVNLDKTNPDDKLNPFKKEDISNPDEIKSLTTRAKDSISIDRDRFVRLRLSLMGIDRLFNRLDGRVNYTGPNYKIFKVPVDQQWNKWKYAENKISMSFYSMLNELKMGEKSSKRIAIHAYNLQRGGRAKLLEDRKMTEAQIDSIKLTEKEMAVYNFMRRHLDDLHGVISKKMAQENNLNLGKPENYFPMMQDYGVTKPLAEEFAGLDRIKSVPFGAMKERQEGAHQLLKLDAFQVFSSYVGKSTYFVAMDSTVRKLTRLAESDRYRKSVGNNAQKTVLTWLDVLARKGGSLTPETPIFKKINELNNNLSVAVLGLRITSTLKQPLAILDGASEIGAYAFSGVRQIMDPKWIEFMNEQSSEIRERFEDPFLEEISHDQTLPRIKYVAMYPLQYLDVLTARAVWAGSYTKYMDEHNLDVHHVAQDGTPGLINLNKEAVEYADRTMRTTQASAAFKDSPTFLTGKDRQAAKLVMKFQMFVLNRWSRLSEDLPDKWKNNKKSAVRMLTWVAISMILEQGITNLWNTILGRGQKKKEEGLLTKGANLFKSILAQTIQTVPFLGQMVSATNYSTNPVPLIEAGNKLFDSMAQMVSAKKTDTKTKHMLRVLSYVIGIGMGVPTDQARQLMETWFFPTTGSSNSSKL